MGNVCLQMGQIFASCACLCTCHPAGRGQTYPLTQPFGTCWTLLVDVIDCKEDAHVLAVQQAPVVLLQNLQCRDSSVFIEANRENGFCMGRMGQRAGRAQACSDPLPYPDYAV